ncbi:MAG: hypothetical protein JXB26_15300 [Candidatus Aminicenantes bacterium]|nr:hypothetical protein [Candidatus Aminicenantes bacterium]
MPNNIPMKPVQIGMTIFTILLIGPMIFGRIFFGPAGFYWAFGFAQIIMAVIHFVVFLRTRFWIYLIPTGMYTLWCLTLFPPFANHPWHHGFAVASAVFLAAFIIVLISKRINWHYKEILQLAAVSVTGTTDGFTSRPYPTGPAEFNRKDALGLARYLKKYVITYPFIEPDRVVLVIPEYMWTYLLFFKRNYEKATYVTLSNSGQVTVRIAENDYRKYKEELTFDQLCASLGDLFKHFLLWYRLGTPENIVSLLNSPEQGHNNEK